jgi:hypothetical protein
MSSPLYNTVTNSCKYHATAELTAEQPTCHLARLLSSHYTMPMVLVHAALAFNPAALVQGLEHMHVEAEYTHAFELQAGSQLSS